MRDAARIKEKIVITLDNRQLALGLLGFIGVCAGVFSAGVLVGQKMGDAVPQSVAELSGLDRELDQTPTRRAQGRVGALSEVPLAIQGVDGQLMRPGVDAAPKDPTEAAKVEAYRQMVAARAARAARALGPEAVLAPAEGAAQAPGGKVSVVHQPPVKRPSLPVASIGAQKAPASAFTLQVSVFKSARPAEVVARQLQGAGHPAQVRQVAVAGSLGESGEVVYRVEVGGFANAAEAGAFQKRFEASSGYASVVVSTK